MGTFDVDLEARPHAVGESVKYRLDVIGSTATDVAGSIGGWLCDRVRAGWDVHVMLAQACDQRPLEILGIRATPLDTRAPLASSEHPVRGLAVSAEMYAADARIERAVLCALDRWMTEVTLWHDDWPPAVGKRTMPVQHVLSAAARAFKRHALAAAGIPGAVSPTESLLSDMKASLPVDSELIPVG